MQQFETALALRGLTKRFDRPAVDALDLTIRTGEFYALLGPNGAGKTTTLRMVAGLLRPDAGSVAIFGIDALKNPVAAKQVMAWVSDEPMIYDKLTPLEYLELVAGLWGIDAGLAEASAHALLVSLGLDPVRDHAALAPRLGVMLQAGGVYPGAYPLEMLRLYASFHADPLDPADLLDRLGLGGATRTTYRRLSGGQQQRLSLALAVVGRPEVVFLDEPTAGLDPQARHATWDLVRELRTGGVTVVLTTHAMDEAEALADDVVIVDRGRVVAAGTPASLTSGGARRITAEPGQSIPGAVEESPGSYVVRRTLEDVFLGLTGRELRS